INATHAVRSVRNVLAIGRREAEKVEWLMGRDDSFRRARVSASFRGQHIRVTTDSAGGARRRRLSPPVGGSMRACGQVLGQKRDALVAVYSCVLIAKRAGNNRRHMTRGERRYVDMTRRVAV